MPNKNNHWIRRLAQKAFENSAITFWRIEAREWRKLFEEQRGGETFNELQRELAEARAEISRLKAERPK